MLEFSIWYFQKLATKTLRFSEDFSEERKATPFLYQLFGKEKSFHFDALLKENPKEELQKTKIEERVVTKIRYGTENS
jgi:hypothetical protein